MKLSNLFLIAALVGVLGAIGCSESTTGNGGNGGSGTAGTGGSAGGGGMGGEGGSGGAIDPNALCDFELCAEDSDLGRAAKAACIDEIESCLTTGEFTQEQCIAFGTETCSADAG